MIFDGTPGVNEVYTHNASVSRDTGTSGDKL